MTGHTFCRHIPEVMRTIYGRTYRVVKSYRKRGGRVITMAAVSNCWRLNGQKAGLNK